MNLNKKQSNNKQLFINIFAQLIAFIVSMGISFVLTPFIVKNVGKEAYGFVGLANDFVNYAEIVTVALNSMAARFITIRLHRNDIESVNKYFTSILIVNVFLAILFSIPSVVIVIFMDRFLSVPAIIVKDIRLLWALIFLNFMITMIGSVFEISVFARNRLEIESLRKIKSNLLRGLLLLVLFSLISSSVWYIGVVSVVCTLYIVLYNIKYTKILLPEVTIRKKYFDINKIKTIVSSGIWNSISKLSCILLSGLDLLLSNIFIGAAAMGTLSLSKTLPNAILSVFGLISSAFAPEFTIYYAEKKFDELKNQLLFSIKILGFIASIPNAILFAYGKEFFRLWVPGQNENQLYVLSLVIASELVFAMPLESLWNVFAVTNKVKKSSLSILISGILTILTLFIGFTFCVNTDIRLLIIGGTSSFYGIIRSLTFLPIYGAKCLELKWSIFYRPIFKNVINVLIITLFSFMVKYLININSWATLIICSIITLLFSILINSILTFNESERMKVIEMVNNKLKIRKKTKLL